MSDTATVIKSIASQAKASLRARGIKPIWFFKTPAIQYGVAIVKGEIWSFTISAARRELRGSVGMPRFLSPTPQLAKGFEKAKRELGIAD
jgi:hypothetical protein